MTLQSPTATLIPLFSSSELTGCGYPGLLDRKNRSDMCPRWESNPRLPACKASTLSTRPGSPLSSLVCVCVCIPVLVRDDVPRVAQWYGTIAAHTRRRASVLVLFVVFCVHMHSFAGLIRRTLPPTFSDTTINDRHSDTTIFQLGAHWVRISRSIGSEKSFGDMCPPPPPGGSRTLDFLRARRAPYPLGQALLFASDGSFRNLYPPLVIVYAHWRRLSSDWF